MFWSYSGYIALVSFHMVSGRRQMERAWHVVFELHPPTISRSTKYEVVGRILAAQPLQMRLAFVFGGYGGALMQHQIGTAWWQKGGMLMCVWLLTRWCAIWLGWGWFMAGCVRAVERVAGYLEEIEGEYLGRD